MPANAGAWIAPKGGQEINTTGVGERNGLIYYGGAGYWEAPLGEKTSFVSNWWVDHNYDTEDGWRGELALSLKRAVYRDDRNVVAVQASGVWLSHPPEGCSEGGGELRVLGGRGFGRTGFANVEVAGRAFDGGCEAGRVDLTVGYRPDENWLAMGQVFSETSQVGEDAVRAQVSLVRLRSNGRAIQLGIRTRIDGGAEETALVFGWWGRGDN